MAYERFKRTVNGIDVWYCWLEIDIDHLDEPIPAQAHGQAGVALILRDFTLSSQTSLNGLKAIICIGAKLESYGRREPVDELALTTWDAYLDGYDYDLEADGLEREQYAELILSPEYKEVL
jgi:hypothetical protein